MLWRIPRSIMIALAVSLGLWISGAFVACHAQEAPPCLLAWSAPPDEEDLVSTIFEFRQVGRAMIATHPAGDEDEYFLFAGAAFDNAQGLVCFDVDYVDGNPKPGAKVRVSMMGQTVCYQRLEDGTIYMEQTDEVFSPDPDKTQRGIAEVCKEPAERGSRT